MTTDGKQLLHFVFGGELKDLGGTEFRDLSKLDIVGFASLEGQGAGNGGQCAYALFRDAFASSDRPCERQELSGASFLRSFGKTSLRIGSARLKYPGPP